METQHPIVWLFYECVEESWWPQNRWQYLSDILAGHFNGTKLINFMAANRYGLVLSVRPEDDLNGLADIVKVLNRYGVPVKFWVVLSDAEGYWLNPLNIAATSEWTWELNTFISANRLKVKGIGFDLEYPVEIGKVYDRPFVMIPKLLKHFAKILFKATAAQERLEFMVDAFRDFKLPIEFYAFNPKIFHFVVGGGLWPVKGSRLITMDYTSYFGNQRASLKRSRGFGSFKNSIPALGILGTVLGKTPGRKLGRTLPPHLDAYTLSLCFEALREMNGGKLPEELYIFALDSADTIRVIETALNS